MLNLDPVNRSNLDIIERAQFVLCLDSSHPDIDAHSTTTTAQQLSVISGRCLHGNGSAHDSCNRWFDHAIQVCIQYYYYVSSVTTMYSALLLCI